MANPVDTQCVNMPAEPSIRYGALTNPAMISQILQFAVLKYSLAPLRFPHLVGGVANDVKQVDDPVDADPAWWIEAAAITILADFAANSDTIKEPDPFLAASLECTAVNVPKSLCLTIPEAKSAIITGYKASLCRITTAVLDSFNIDGLRHPMCRTGEDATEPDWDHVVKVARKIGIVDKTMATKMRVNQLALAIVSCCKLGSITWDYANKVVQAIQKEIQVNITLNPDTVREYWNWAKRSINEVQVQEMFTAWEQTVGKASSCLQFVLQQARWAGMTNYQNIQHALKTYEDFPWNVLNAAAPRDFVNYRAAVNAVGNNEYYGYRVDLGSAKSTLYPNLAYAAKQLRLIIGGERSWRHFQGNNSNIPHAGLIDRQIQKYLIHNSTQPDFYPTHLGKQNPY